MRPVLLSVGVTRAPVPRLALAEVRLPSAGLQCWAQWSLVLNSSAERCSSLVLNLVLNLVLLLLGTGAELRLSLVYRPEVQDKVDFQPECS
jgi:hypothetical protein